MRYSVVLLDVGGTLIGPRESFGAVYAEVLSELGLTLSRDILEPAIRQSMAEMNQRIPLGKDRYRHFPGGEREYWLRFVDRVLQLAQGSSTASNLAEQSLGPLSAAFGESAAWRIYDDTIPALNDLKRLGIRLGVVSNWDSNLPRVLDLMELTPFFEVIGVSHTEGREKPDPHFFHSVLKRMHAEPGHTLHVGDSPVHDGDGARAAGIASRIIDRKGGASGAYRSIRSLRDIAAIVS